MFKQILIFLKNQPSVLTNFYQIKVKHFQKKV